MDLRRSSAQILILLGDAIVSFLSALLLYMLISRFRGAELLGQYSLVVSWIALFQAIGNFGIPEFIIRELGRHFGQEKKHMSHGLAAGLLVSAVASAAIVLSQRFFPYPAEIRHALALGALTIVPATLSAICRGGFLVHRRSDKVFLLGLLDFALTAGVNGYLILHGRGIVPMVWVMLGGKIVTCAVGLLLLARSATPLRARLDPALFKEMLAPMLTFAVSNWLWLGTKRINVIMLSVTAGFAAVGFYAAANAFTEVSFMIPIVITQLALPRLSQSIAHDTREGVAYFEKMIGLLLSLTFPLVAGGIYFAQPLVRIAFGARFEGSVAVLRVLMLVFLLESADSLMSILLKAAGRQKNDVQIFVWNPVTNVVLNLVLIPAFGGVGAAGAKAAAVLCSTLLHGLFLPRLGIKIAWLHKAARPALFSAAVLVVVAALGGFVPPSAQMGLYAVLSAIVFFRISGLAGLDEFRGATLAGPSSERAGERS